MQTDDAEWRMTSQTEDMILHDVKRSGPMQYQSPWNASMTWESETVSEMYRPFLQVASKYLPSKYDCSLSVPLGPPAHQLFFLRRRLGPQFIGRNTFIANLLSNSGRTSWTTDRNLAFVFPLAMRFSWSLQLTSAVVEWATVDLLLVPVPFWVTKPCLHYFFCMQQFVHELLKWLVFQ